MGFFQLNISQLNWNSLFKPESTSNVNEIQNYFRPTCESRHFMHRRSAFHYLSYVLDHRVPGFSSVGRRRVRIKHYNKEIYERLFVFWQRLIRLETFHLKDRPDLRRVNKTNEKSYKVIISSTQISTREWLEIMLFLKSNEIERDRDKKGSFGSVCFCDEVCFHDSPINYNISYTLHDSSSLRSASFVLPSFFLFVLMTSRGFFMPLVFEPFRKTRA